MSLIITGYNPDDYKDLVKKGAVLYCDTRHLHPPALLGQQPDISVTVEKTGILPEGWIIVRESFSGNHYALSVFCPACDQRFLRYGIN